jgi:hypothetical protein
MLVSIKFYIEASMEKFLGTPTNFATLHPGSVKGRRFRAPGLFDFFLFSPEMGFDLEGIACGRVGKRPQRTSTGKNLV